MSIVIKEIRRHPVKSLGGETLPAVGLVPGRSIPCDRRYALVPAEEGGREPAAGWRPKSRCVVLVRHAGLARIEAHYDAGTGVLALIAHGEKVSSGRPEFSGERAGLEATLNDAFADEVGTRLALAAAGDGAMIGDVEGPVISLINLSSLAALERELGQALDPRRFRANLYFAGAPAWTERAWPGRQIRIGGATLDVIAPIRRCAATEVNPDTTDRDAAVLRGLKKGFDHTEMGVYARTVTPGEISPGAVLAV